MNRKDIGKRIVKISVLSIILFFLIRSVLSNWGIIQTYDWSFHPLLMTVSCLLFFTAFILLPWVWQKVLHYMGCELRYRDAWDIYYIGNLGRYIPGKIWGIAGMVYMAEKTGISKRIVGTAAIFAQAYSLVSSFVFLIILIIFKGDYFANFRFIWMLPIFFVLVIIFIFPKNLEHTLNFTLKKIGKSPVTIGITTVTALKILFFYFLVWMIAGVAFGVFVSSIVGWGKINLLVSAGVYVIAYVVGFLAVFAPGGFGVREGVLGLLLMNTIPVSVGIIIAALSRLLVTGIEIICVVPALMRRGIFYGKEKAVTEKRR